MIDPDHFEEYQIAGHYLSYLINGDVSGYTEEDERLVYEFEERATKGINKWHWSYPSDPDTGEIEGPGFTRCDISGLRAECVTLHLVNMDKVIAARTITG